MPLYEDEKLTREDLFELRLRNRCGVCHGMLNVFLDMNTHRAYLACNSDQTHEGIARGASPPFKPNIPTRRKEMVEELGKERATKLEKYQLRSTLERAEAMEILRTIWPGAPDPEVTKAAILCSQYGLNPLMKHVFLIPFKKRDAKGNVIGEDWVVVLGIGASRHIAREAGDYSYLEGTPRVMTEKEQIKTFGAADPSRIWAITKLRDSKGNEAPGYGFWLRDEKPYGAEKGNTALNMAFIRSERNALDRLFAGKLPQEVEIIEEKYLELPSKPEVGGGKAVASAEEGVAKTQAAVSPPTKEKAEKIAAAPPASPINLDWLNESLGSKGLKWSEVATKTFLTSHYKVDGKGTLAEVLQRLTREQAEDFVKEINSRLEKQPKLI